MIPEYIVQHNIGGPWISIPQIDGSDHRWFEERAPARTLPVYVGDATSRSMMPPFMRTESTVSYFEASRCRC